MTDKTIIDLQEQPKRGRGKKKQIAIDSAIVEINIQPTINSDIKKEKTIKTIKNITKAKKTINIDKDTQQENVKNQELQESQSLNLVENKSKRGRKSINKQEIINNDINVDKQEQLQSEIHIEKIETHRNDNTAVLDTIKQQNKSKNNAKVLKNKQLKIEINEELGSSIANTKNNTTKGMNIANSNVHNINKKNKQKQIDDQSKKSINNNQSKENNKSKQNSNELIEDNGSQLNNDSDNQKLVNQEQQTNLKDNQQLRSQSNNKSKQRNWESVINGLEIKVRGENLNQDKQNASIPIRHALLNDVIYFHNNQSNCQNYLSLTYSSKESLQRAIVDFIIKNWVYYDYKVVDNLYNSENAYEISKMLKSRILNAISKKYPELQHICGKMKATN